MFASCPNRHRQLAVLLLAIALIPLTAAGCNLIPNRTSSEAQPTAVASGNTEYGPCWPIYSSGVQSVSMGRDGLRVLFVSSKRPSDIDASSWSSSSRALYVMQYPSTGEAAPTIYYIATNWAAPEDIQPYATPKSPSSTPKAVPIPEQMADAQIAGTGDRFIVAVKRDGVVGRYAKLYSGTVPAGPAELNPGEDGGLKLVPINDYKSTEGIQSYALSDDGSKVAAVVGQQGEVRVYDLNTSQLTVYTRGPDGKTVVSHELPPALTTIANPRQPAIASQGTVFLSWAPSSDRLALGVVQAVGNTAAAIVDAATGAVSVVRRFTNSTVPNIAWASDGKSIFTMATALSGAQIFGDTEIRRLAAETDGAEVSPGGKLPRPLGYRTEPAYLAPFGDDENFAFLWEGELYRLTAPGGVPAKASYVQLTPPDLHAAGGLPSTSLKQSRVEYRALDDSGTYVGERRDALSEQCTLYPTPVGGATQGAPGTPVPAATEQEGATAAPAQPAASPTVAGQGPAATAAAPIASPSAAGAAAASPTSGG